MGDPAVDANWLNLFTAHWAALPQPTRELVLAAAERTELTSIPGLRDNLVQHLLESEEVEPWRYATQLWHLASADQQSSLLAYARTHCPALDECAAHADLLAALVERASESLPAGAVVRLTPVLMSAEPELARALGRALRPLPRTARKLRKAMDGHSSTPGQRARNAAFKEGSAI